MIELHLKADTPEQLDDYLKFFQSKVSTDSKPIHAADVGNTTDTVVVQEQQTEPPTQEQLRDALVKVSEKHGLVKAKELVKRFGASRVSDLPKTDYIKFSQAIDEVMK